MTAVSSEAMLGGQKSPYKLLVRAVNQHTGAEVPYITFVASEDFVVSQTFVCLALPEDPAPKLPLQETVSARGMLHHSE